MTFGEFIDDNGRIFFALSLMFGVVIVAVIIDRFDTRDTASITACPQQEVRIVQADRTCDLGLMNRLFAHLSRRG